MRKLLMMLVMGVTAFAAQADLLYFMVNGFSWDGPQHFDFAMVGVKNASDLSDAGYLMIQSTPQSGAGQSQFVMSDDRRYTATGWADFGDYAADGYLFYIETYAFGSDDPILQYNDKTARTYAELFGAGHVYQPGVTDPQDVTPWSVPEPTGGMLVLLGFAALALKRGREV